MIQKTKTLLAVLAVVIAVGFVAANSITSQALAGGSDWSAGIQKPHPCNGNTNSKFCPSAEVSPEPHIIYVGGSPWSG